MWCFEARGTLLPDSFVGIDRHNGRRVFDVMNSFVGVWYCSHRLGGLPAIVCDSLIRAHCGGFGQRGTCCDCVEKSQDMPFGAFQVGHAWLGDSDTGQTSQDDDQGPVVGHVLLRGRSEVGELSPAGEQEMWVAPSGLTSPSEITEAAHSSVIGYSEDCRGITHLRNLNPH